MRGETESGSEDDGDTFLLQQGGGEILIGLDRIVSCACTVAPWVRSPFAPAIILSLPGPGEVS